MIYGNNPQLVLFDELTADDYCDHDQGTNESGCCPVCDAQWDFEEEDDAN